MSRRNVEVVRRGIEAWNRRDRAMWVAAFHPDAEVDWSRSRGPLMGVYRGRDGLESFWDGWFSTFERTEIETHGFREAGSEIVVPNTAHARGRQGIEVIAKSTLVFSIGNRQITRLRMFQEHDDALAAVGLSQQNADADS